MANNMQLSQNYSDDFQEALFLGEKTGDLVNADKFNFAGAKTVNVLKVDIDDLKQYNRQTGYGNAGIVNATYQSMTMEADIYNKYGVDHFDNEEEKMVAISGVLAEVAIKGKKTQDFYRLSKIAGTSGVTVANAITISNGATAVAELDKAEAQIVEDESDRSDCNLYATPTFLQLLKRELGDKSGRFTLGTDEYNNQITYFDEMKVIEIPQSRMYVGVQLNSTTNVWEPKVTNAKTQKVNFMIVNRTSVVCPLKVDTIKLIDWLDNPNGREDIIVPTIYFDAFVLDKRAKGIYVCPNVAS